MIFVDNKIAFGRHQTFSLRYSWLTKGFQELEKNPKIFTDDYATVKLGVGKNMVNSICYWLQAAQIAIPDKKNGGFQATDLGTSIFANNKGFDVYLEDEATIWLIHWLLASNPSIATSWYWFFNHFHKPEFTHKDVLDSLHKFTNDHTRSNIAIGTLKKDVDIILRMYSRSKTSAKRPVEDVLDSPLSLLNLISNVPQTKSYYSISEARDKVPIGIIGFAVTSIFQQMEKNRTIPIENLMYKRGDYPALGAVFRMTESALLAKLELLTHYIPDTLDMRESAGINQLHQLNTINPTEYLIKHYFDALEVEAIV